VVIVRSRGLLGTMGILSSFVALVIGFGYFEFPASPSKGDPDSVRTCQTAQLTITFVHTGGAGPTVGGLINFKNHGRQVCRIRGWPKVTAVTATGQVTVAEPYRTTMLGPFRYFGVAPKVILQPGRSVVAALVGSEVGHHLQCPPFYRTLHITPPQSSARVTLSAWLQGLDTYLPACTPLQVSMILPSSAMGFQHTPNTSWGSSSNRTKSAIESESQP